MSRRRHTAYGMRLTKSVAWVAGFSCALSLAPCALSEEAHRPIPLRPGSEFQSPEARAMQLDDFANPGLLWVERGEKLWSEPRGAANKSCASCHGDAAQSMKTAAAHHPRYYEGLGVLDLEGRIKACVVKKQRAPDLPWESQELLSLSTYVARQAKGQRIDVVIPAHAGIQSPMRQAYERGKHLYFERQGQLNLACTNCHDANWGKTLLAERISQGHPGDWPAYRIEWQTLGSLQRRLRACYFGVRAELPPLGSPDLVALEVYLADRAKGLELSPPGVRR
jgi:sulfur-oxidizing protein SoxA